MHGAYPDYWIGLNCLDLDPWEMFCTVPSSVSGVWSDDTGYDEQEDVPLMGAVLCWVKRKQRKDWDGLYFGGVAFKYQKKVSDVGRVAWLVTCCVDVVTTSGDATGSSPLVSKIKKMKKAIGTFPLAIARGITPENVAEFMPYVDCFLVATGISKNFTELDPERVSLFAEALRT